MLTRLFHSENSTVRSPMPSRNSSRPQLSGFWCDDGTCRAIPFFQIAFMHCHPKEQTLLIECSPGTVATGSKAGEFLERF